MGENDRRVVKGRKRDEGMQKKDEEKREKKN